jgi:hypothetical protein
MLLYLSTNSRPDICFAVSQVARFTHSPKQSHATAVKTIVRYLFGTRDRGTIVHPTGDLRLLAWVDADFAGLYKSDPDYDPTSAKSRMGYLISLAGCPLVWKSQLLHIISLSTFESEYVALSACMRVLLPIRRTLLEIAEHLGLEQALRATIRARVFEDNNSALQLATANRLSSRTRHLHVQYHHFWQEVKASDGGILIERIDTHLQDADYATKSLPRESFEKNRLRVQGW